MLYIAHRGACRHLPENSVAAFRQAEVEGFNGVEFDVRTSKDGGLFILHDSRLHRTTNMKGKIAEKTSRQLSRCRLSNGEPLPTLERTLEAVKDFSIILLEIKSPGCEEKVLSLLSRHGLKKKTIICSFKKNILRKVRMLDDNVRIDYERFMLMPRHIETLQELGCNSVGFRLSVMRKKHIRWLKKKNILIIPYAVESKKVRDKWAKKGVDGFCVKSISPI